MKKLGLSVAVVRFSGIDSFAFDRDSIVKRSTNGEAEKDIRGQLL